MQNYCSLAEAIDELAMSYESFHGEKSKIIDEIRLKLFEYTYFLIIDKTGDEDHASAFFLDLIAPKIKTILDAFESGKGAFCSFYRSICFSYYNFYKMSAYREKSKENLMCALVRSSRLDDSAEISYAFGGETGLVVGESEAGYVTGASLEDAGRVIEPAGRADKVGVMAYALRCANFLDEVMISNIARYADADESGFRDMVDRAKGTIEGKRDSIEYHSEKSDYYFMKMLALMYRKEHLSGEITDADERKIARYSRLNRTHASKARLLMFVSEMDVAEILGVQYDNVRKLIHRAKLRLAKMCLHN